jgi:hypothetical protein
MKIAKSTSILLSLLLSANAFGAALDCDSFKKKLEELNPKKKAWPDVIVPEKKIDDAIAALERPFNPSPSDVRDRIKSLKKNPEETFPKYLEENIANCTLRRADLSIALLATAARKKTSEDDRARIKDSIRDILRSTRKFPTMIAASSDAKVMEFGAKKKVWIVTPEVLAEIKVLHAKIKSEVDAEQRTYGKPWDKMTKEMGKLADDAAKAEFLKTSPEFQKMRSHILAEPIEAGHYLKEVQKIADSLS